MWSARMWRSIVIAVAAAVIVGLLAGLAARKAPDKSKGMRALTWPAGTRILAVILFAGSFFVAWAATHARPSQVLPATLVSTAFLLGSAYMAYCVFLYRVWWTTEGIGSWHPLGGRRFIRWDDVEGGRYIGWAQVYVLRGGGRRIWYSPMHAGLAHLHRFISSRLKAVSVEDGSRI
jgi:hypothetical protein